MDRSSVFATLAIIILFFIYVSALRYSYFLINEIVITNILALAAAIFLYLAYTQRGKTIKPSKKISIPLLLGIVLFFILIIFRYLGSAVIVSVVGIMVFGHFSKKMKSHRLYAFIIAGVIITSIFTCALVLRMWGPSWRGVDEITYGYYASYFVLHGKDPYTINMAPSLTQYNTPATIQLNGTVEGAYNYPALSLFPTILLSLLNLYGYVNVAMIAAFITIAISFLIYYKSNYNAAVLLPIVAWLFASYDTVPTINQYLAVGVFLVLAYMLRKRTLVYGVLLGLAASTIQLAWFALPFFLILTLREEGRKKFLQPLAIALVVFLLINGYFILQNPKAFLIDVFGVFGTSKLLPGGANIAQFFISSYGVPLWVPAVITIITFITFMVLFYFYTATLRPLIAIVPMFIFFLSWRNLEYYGLAFIPLILVLCYHVEKEKLKDTPKNRIYIIAVLAAIALLFLGIIIYGHAIYTKENTLSITHMMPLITGSNGTHTINTIRLSVANNGNSYEQVSFLYVFNNGNSGNYTLSSTLNGIAPYSTKNYTLDFVIKNVTNRSKIYMMAFSKDYITSQPLNLSGPLSGR